MTASTFPALTLVCYREVCGEQGSGIVWYVRLPDGRLMECGWGFLAKDEAEDIAKRLNESKLGHAGI